MTAATVLPAGSYGQLYAGQRDALRYRNADRAVDGHSGNDGGERQHEHESIGTTEPDYDYSDGQCAGHWQRKLHERYDAAGLGRCVGRGRHADHFFAARRVAIHRCCLWW